MLVTEEEYNRRLQICHQCPHIHNQKVPICNLCGCMLKMKARLDGFECPIGKWSEDGKVTSPIMTLIPGCNSCGKRV